MEEVNDIEEIYRSIPHTIPDPFTPIPVHRQYAGNSRWTKLMNTISLAHEIVRLDDTDSERYVWAKNILNKLSLSK